MPTRELVSRDLRRLLLGGVEIDYILVRRRGRRGVGLKVDPSGLTVNAPSPRAACARRSAPASAIIAPLSVHSAGSG